MGIFLHHTRPYFLRQQALTEPDTHRFGYTGWPVRSRSLPVVTPPARGCGHALLHLAFCVRAGDLSLHSKYFTDWATASTPWRENPTEWFIWTCLCSRPCINSNILNIFWLWRCLLLRHQRRWKGRTVSARRITDSTEAWKLGVEGTCGSCAS